MARKIKAPSQPLMSEERALFGAVENETEYVKVRNKRISLRDLCGWARHKITKVLLKEGGDEFAVILKKGEKQKLVEASNTIEFATKKSRTIERKLKNIAIENTQQEYLDLNDESETNETNEQDLLGDSDE